MAANAWQLVATGVFCGLGVLTAATYLLTSQKGRGRRGIWALESAEAFGKRMRRRRFGAALLAATCIAMFLGLNTLEPAGYGLGYLAYWLIVLIMLGWLVALALATFRH